MGVPGNNNYFVFIISRRVLAISPRFAVVFPQRPLTQKAVQSLNTLLVGIRW
jgi:hypothetical protein